MESSRERTTFFSSSLKREMASKLSSVELPRKLRIYTSILAVDENLPMRILQFTSWLGFWAMRDWYPGNYLHPNWLVTDAGLVFSALCNGDW